MVRGVHEIEAVAGQREIEAFHQSTGRQFAADEDVAANPDPLPRDDGLDRVQFLAEAQVPHFVEARHVAPTVTVPRAERYAVHKLIVAAARENQAKARKYILQAGQLIGILAEQRPLELAEAWEAAWSAGPRWRMKLARGRARLGAEIEDILARVLARSTAKPRAPRRA